MLIKVPDMLDLCFTLYGNRWCLYLSCSWMIALIYDAMYLTTGESTRLYWTNALSDGGSKWEKMSDGRSLGAFCFVTRKSCALLLTFLELHKHCYVITLHYTFIQDYMGVGHSPRSFICIYIMNSCYRLIYKIYQTIVSFFECKRYIN